jgi:hypothetical protein
VSRYSGEAAGHCGDPRAAHVLHPGSDGLAAPRPCSPANGDVADGVCTVLGARAVGVDGSGRGGAG